MLKQIIPLGFVVTLMGCGGSSSKDETPARISSDDILVSSFVNFYVPPWQSPQGTLNIFNRDLVLEESIKVDDINTVNVSVSPLAFNVFEFIPNDNILPCPRFSGCGRTSRDDVNDLNQNRLIDYQEKVTASLDYKAAALNVPGVNTLYLSPLSTVLTNKNYTAVQASLSARSFYQLTHPYLNESLEAEMLTNAFTYAAIVNKVTNADFNLDNALDTYLSSSANSQQWLNYTQLANDYVTENLFNELGDTAIQKVAAEVRQTIASVATFKNWQVEQPISYNLDSRELLEDTRNVIGLIRLQEQSYSDELTQKLTELETAFDEDTQKTLTVFGNVLQDVITNFSPLTDEEITEGRYKLGNLDIAYSESPFRWGISGDYDGLPVSIDLLVPSFRISGILGNKLDGEISGTITNGDTTLTLSVNSLLIQLDGSDQINELNPDADTGIAELKSFVEIKKLDKSLAADVTLNMNRFISSTGNVSTTLSAFDFNGRFESDIQATHFHVTAIEATPFLGEENDDLVFTFELDFPLSGANDFKFAYAGNIDNLSQLTSSDIFLSLKNRALDITARDINGNIDLTIKGENGRWLQVKQKDKDYTGGLYSGDTKIADVKTVRGIPGVLFKNGDFESLF